MHILLDTLGLVDGRQLGPELAGDLLHQVGRKPVLDFGLDMESRDVYQYIASHAHNALAHHPLSREEEEEAREEASSAFTRTESSSSARNSTSTSGRRQCSQ
jgi:hypothetical protein